MQKTAVITGASSGIGRELASLLSKKGYNLALLARRKDRLNKLKEEIKGPKVETYVCDVSKKQEVKKVAAKIIKDFQKIDLLINNAGFGIYNSIEETTIEDYEGLIRTNYFGTVYMTKNILPILLKQRKGHIINIASVAGKSGFPLTSAYNASKFAVAGFTEAIYYDLKPKGIAVTLVCPSATRTEFYNHPSWSKFPHEDRHKHIMGAKEVAEEIIKAIKNKSPEIIIPRRSKYILKGKAVLPNLYRKATERMKR